jgi:hypothetical protein
VHEALFNGLGSRGVLLAPWCSQHLADHLFRGMPLDAEVAQLRETVQRLFAELGVAPGAV